MNWRLCDKCQARMYVTIANKEYWWICGKCPNKFSLTADESLEYQNYQKALQSGKFYQPENEAKVQKVVKEAAKTAEVVVGLAADKTKIEVAKDVGIGVKKVGKIEKVNKELIDETKDFLIQQNLDISKRATEIMKENDYNKLKTLDGYKLTLAGKIAADAALMLGGDNLKNLNIVNFQMLVERLDKTEQMNKTFGKEEYNKPIDAEVVEDKK